MATGSGTHSSLIDTPLPQSVRWRLLSPLSPIDVRQRKLVNVDSDVQFLVSSTPYEADKDDARVLGARSEDLRFETIKEGGPENVKADSYNRNRHAVSKSAISSPVDNLLETIDTLITEKFEKLGTSMDHLLRERSVGSCSEIKDGRETSASQETKGVETGKTECRAALTRTRTKATVKADTYDGSQPFLDYMTHFEHCAMINDWSETEKGLRLAACLRKDALQVLTDLQVQPGQVEFEKLKASLEARFAPRNQDEYYKAQLRSCFRKRGETLPELGQTIQRLVSLAYPGCPPDIRDRLAKDYFLGAVQDENLKLEIWRHRPNSLQEAIMVGVEWEAFLRAGVKQKPISSACTDYKESADMCEESTDKTVIEQLQAKVEKLMEQNKKLTEEHNKRLDPWHQSGHKPRDTRRSGVQCWNCNGWGHYESECTRPLSKDNEQRRKIDQRKGDLKKIGNTGNPKPVRYVNEEPGLYTQCLVNGVELALLADTGAAVSIISKRRYEALAHRKPKLGTVDSQLISASSNKIETYGQAEFLIAWKGVRRRHVFVVADIRPDGILGLDFFRLHKCDISITQCTLQMQGLKLPCYFAGSLGCNRITLAENIRVPAEREVITRGWMANVGCGKLATESVLEPLSSFRHETKILVAHAVVKTMDGTVPIRLLNPTKEVVNLQAGVCCAEASAALSTQNVDRSRQDSNVSLPSHLSELFERSSGHLTPEQAAALSQQLSEFRTVFAKDDDDLGRTNLIKHSVKTGNAAPIRVPPRRLPFHLRQEIDMQVDDMLKKGVIEPSVSPWAAPVVLVAKKDGKKRFCVDYRALNAVTEKDAYPLPRIDDSLDSLSGMSWFSTLDLMSGYWQVEIEQADRPKTAFATRRGLYQFKVMSFGLCNAPGTFERLMEAVLAGLQYEICLIYLDDVIVFGSTFEQLLERQARVFTCLLGAGLKLKPSKCTLCAREVRYLGHTISAAGIATDPEKVAVVMKWPTPKSVTAVRRFLGFCSYYRRYVGHFAEIAAPLHQLTTKNSVFSWTEKHQAAFQKLCKALASAPVLAIPDFNCPFILDTDASGEAIGAVLSQNIDGKERVVAYASRCLDRTERQYCVTRRELLAVVHFVQHFKTYLYGRNFKVRTDHSSLRWLMSFKEPEGQLARWLERLSEYDFVIEHRPGTRHANADGLSRLPCNGCKYCSKRTVGFSAIRLDSGIHFGEVQRQDATLSQVISWVEAKQRPAWEEVSGSNTDIKALWGAFKLLELSDEKLVRVWLDRSGKPVTKFIVVPCSWRREVLKQCHDGAAGGHLGVDKTLSKVRQRYYWPGMRDDVRDYCATCSVCAQHKGPKQKHRAKLQGITAGEAGELVALDILGPLTKTEEGNAYILVIGDHFTKWIEAVPLPNIEATTVARALLDNFICRFGVPRVLLSDQGRQFESAVFKELCVILGIKKTRTSPYHPQCNGMVERYNRTLCQMLAAYVDDKPENWDQYLSLTSMAYRASEHTSSGFTPNKLMLGREVILPTDLLVGKTPDEAPKSLPRFVAEYRKAMWEANEEARTKIGTAIRHQKVAYDLKVHGQSFSDGDLVWLHHTLRKKGKSPKLQVKWTGPWRIVKRVTDVTYLIARSNHKTTQIVHFNRLKPCLVRAESEHQHPDSQEEIPDSGDDTEKEEVPPYPITAQRASLMERRRERRRDANVIY